LAPWREKEKNVSREVAKPQRKKECIAHILKRLGVLALRLVFEDDVGLGVKKKKSVFLAKPRSRKGRSISRKVAKSQRRKYVLHIV
jgi:hypothetical protein